MQCLVSLHVYACVSGCRVNTPKKNFYWMKQAPERERKKLSTQVKTTNKYNIHTLVCPVMKEETARNELLSIYGDAERMRVCQYKLFLRLRFSSSFKFLIVAVVVTFPYFSFWVFSRALLSDSCWLPPKVLLLARSLLFSVSTLDVILYCD